jgi:hypothetical protein
MKAKDLYAWIYELALFNPKVAELAERVKKRHDIVVRPIDSKHMEEEIKYFLEIYAKAWKDNWGFVAPTPAEAAHFASELKQILDPEFALCCEVAGVRAGCIVAVPDMNQVLKGRMEAVPAGSGAISVQKTAHRPGSPAPAWRASGISRARSPSADGARAWPARLESQGPPRGVLLGA